MGIQRFKRFIPCIQCVPQNCQEDKRRIHRLVEYVLPIHALSDQSHASMQVLGRDRVPFLRRVVADDGTLGAAHHMDGEEIEEENASLTCLSLKRYSFDEKTMDDEVD
jgi:hypothetical protein